MGYRADRILRLAKSFRDGTVDPDWLEAPERTRCQNESQLDYLMYTELRACADRWRHVHAFWVRMG